MATLFTGGKVFDGKGTLLEGHAVLVEGDKIAKVAPAGEFDGFAGDVVDTSGGTLLPGMADCHVHLCYDAAADPNASMMKKSTGQIALTVLSNAQTSLKSGITMIRDCGGKDYIEFSVRDAIRKGQFVGPSIHAAGRMICMTGGHGNRTGRVADGCDEVKKAVREQVHAGCDLIKIMATGGVMTPGVNPEDAHYSPEEMTAGVHEAKRFHKPTASHAQGTEGILNAVRAGISSIEHGIFMSEKCYEEMLESGTYLVPTLAALRNILENAGNGIPDYVIEKSLRIADIHKASFKRFYELGGKIALGTDAGTPFNKHGENLQELRYMVEGGMTTTDALITATSNAADLIGLPEQGSIAEGMLADLVIVDGDPVADIEMAADKTNHRAVYKNGVLVGGGFTAPGGLALAAE